MNKKIIIPLALAPLAAPALQAQHQQPNGRTDTRPNIILFMVDDMGWQDTSLPFWTQKTHYNEVYETPNMAAPCQTRYDVHPSLCQQHQFAHPL